MNSARLQQLPAQLSLTIAEQDLYVSADQERLPSTTSHAAFEAPADGSLDRELPMPASCADKPVTSILHDNQASWHTPLRPSAAGHYGPLLAKRILDYNAWAKKANQQLKGDQRQHLIINLGGLAMGNAWTDAYHDNTATLDFWWVCNNVQCKLVRQPLPSARGRPVHCKRRLVVCHCSRTPGLQQTCV